MPRRSSDAASSAREGDATTIRARGVTKRFGDSVAIQELDLDVKSGECVGLLGPNGAGKSTFIGCLYGVVLRSGGDLKVFGHDPAIEPRQIKQRLGVVPQENALDEELTVLENMQLYARFEGLPKRAALPRIDGTARATWRWTISGRTDSNAFRRHEAPARLCARSAFGSRDADLGRTDDRARPDRSAFALGEGSFLSAGGQERRSSPRTTCTKRNCSATVSSFSIAGSWLALGAPRELIAREAPGYVGIFPHDREQLLRAHLQRDWDLFHQGRQCCIRAPQIEDLMELQQNLRHAGACRFAPAISRTSTSNSPEGNLTTMSELSSISLRLAWQVVIRNWVVYRKDFLANISPTLGRSRPDDDRPRARASLRSSVKIDGLTYAQYLAPGMVATTALFTAFFECSYGFYVRMTFESVFKAMLTTPIGVREIVLGEFLWVFIRASLMAAGVGLVLVVVGLLPNPWSILVFPFIGGMLAVPCGAIGLLACGSGPKHQSVSDRLFLSDRADLFPLRSLFPAHRSAGPRRARAVITLLPWCAPASNGRVGARVSRGGRGSRGASLSIRGRSGWMGIRKDPAKTYDLAFSPITGPWRNFLYN